MRNRRFFFPLVLMSISLAASSGEPDKATPTQAPPVNPAPAPTPPAVSLKPRVIDWKQVLADFQGADTGKQISATQTLIESGSNGYNMLGTLVNNPNADIAKRATDARTQIDKRTYQLYQEVLQLDNKVQQEPLTTKALEELKQGWLRLAAYAPQNELRQNAYEKYQEAQRQIKSVEESNQQLLAQDMKLKAMTDTVGIPRAALQLDRANTLVSLHRYNEGLAAAQDAVHAGGKEGRQTAAALKVQCETYMTLQDAKNAEIMCRALLQDYPRSLEVKYAYSTLIQLLTFQKKWDEAIQLSKTFVTLCPIDDGAQDAVYGLLNALMNNEHDYGRAAPYADWIMTAFPADRLTPEVPKIIGGCSEYLLRDYAKATQAYTLLQNQFADVVSAADMKSVLERCKIKADGKFAKEPAVTDEGIPGVFAQFLKAVRARDSKALADLVPKDSAEDILDDIKGEGFDNDLVPIVTFADFIIKKVEIDKKEEKKDPAKDEKKEPSKDEKKDAAKDNKKDEPEQTATITIDYYEPSSNTPKALTEEAVFEGGKWKISWEMPETDNAQGVQLTPNQ